MCKNLPKENLHKELSLLQNKNIRSDLDSFLLVYTQECQIFWQKQNGIPDQQLFTIHFLILKKSTGNTLLLHIEDNLFFGMIQWITLLCKPNISIYCR